VHRSRARWQAAPADLVHEIRDPASAGFFTTSLCVSYYCLSGLHP
jgi:hypothetical protein